jgi:drug/metabolite transporter (DMT)-like permease
MSRFSRFAGFLSGNIFAVIGVILILGGIYLALNDPHWTGIVLIVAGVVAIAVNTVIRMKRD